MSNFVTGLVQRGAGLPLPVVPRPAIGPQNMLHDPGTSEAVAEASPAALPAGCERRTSSDITTAEFSSRSALAAQPLSDARTWGAFSGKWREKASPEIADIHSTQRPATSQLDASRALGLTEVRPVPRSNEGDGKTTPIVKVATAPPVASPGNGETTKSSPTTKESNASSAIARALQPSRPLHGKREDASVQPLRVRAVPRQEPAAVGRPVQQGPTATPKTGQGAAPEPRIQVKIGRVEIRSIQPAPPLRAPRKQTAGGFADLKLARTHLDRSAW